MTLREQLLKKLEQTPDILLEAILDFCLFLRQRQQNKSHQQPSPAQVLEEIAALPLEGNAGAFSGQDHDQILYS